MLARIRKGSDSLFIRIILALIAFSFVGVGAAAFVGGNSRGNIVEFTKAPAISMEEFQLAKAQQVDALQRENGVNLTEENIAELGIDRSVLTSLINDSMVKYLASYYDFDISEKKLIDLIKTLPTFKNQNGEFDLATFKAAFRGSPRREEEYLASIKKNLITSMLLDSFAGSFYVSKTMTENMIDYMSETRTLDILSIDLDYKPKNYKAKKLEKEQLEEFYKGNQTMFIEPELRSFSYLKADEKFLSKRLELPESELKQYFEENIDDFAGAKYTKVKKQVRQELKKNKLEELVNELAKNFEEDVASGLTVQEIATKYDLKLMSVNSMSIDALNSSAKPEYAELADNLFEMMEGEVSYPIEVQDQNAILLAAIDSVTPSRQLAFDEVVKQITYTLTKRALALENVKRLEDVQKNYDPKKISSKTLNAKGISYLANKSFTRAEAPLNEKFPSALLEAAMSYKAKTSTMLIGDGKKAHFAYVKHIKNNKTKAKKIKENSEVYFANIIKDAMFQELISHLIQQNEMQVTQEDQAN